VGEESSFPGSAIADRYLVIARGRTGAGKKIMAMLPGRRERRLFRRALRAERLAEKARGAVGEARTAFADFGQKNRPPFVCQIIENLLQSLDEKYHGRCRYSHETYMFCTMLKTLSPGTDGFLRQFLPLPQSERVEEYFEEKIDHDDEMIADMERAAEGLMRDGSQFVGDGYDGFLAVDGQPDVPVLLEVDALAIEPC
jgi:hypothetical protein